MDIRKFSVSPVGRIELKDAEDQPMLTDDGKPLVVNVYGPGSKEHAKAQAVQNNRFVARLKNRKGTDVTPEQKLEDDAQFLADITASFENVEFDKLTGRELALAIYRDKSLGFIADQVAAYVGNWANFTQDSKAS